MRRAIAVLTALGAAALCAAPAPLLASEDAQGFFRVVEGAATLFRVEDGQPEAARENAPALAGDRVSLAPGARVEVILPDGHRLRLAESADLELVVLARSLDQEGEATVLQLSNGALAVDVPRDALDRTRVDTDAAAVLLDRGGLYLVEIDDRGATRVVVRAGGAEVKTEYDSTLVRAGEEAVIDPDRRAQVALYQAPALTDVEEWARQLEAEAARAQASPVEPELRYAALPLDRYGSWVDAGAGYAWRPRVALGWRPYWMGRWKYSPAGLVWCSYEPWGWVPYHYGAWDLHPSYGWLWYPGAVYRPAHVVWYWGSSFAGWIPSGYYGGYYARHFGFNVSFGSGFYGVSHASWLAYRDWVFCPTSWIGQRYQYRFHGDHRVLEHHGGFRGAERAFITADTRGLDRAHWREPAAVEEVLGRRAHRLTGGAGDLPDVSAVVARGPDVSGAMLRDLTRGDDERQVAVRRPASPRGAEIPTDPAGGGDVGRTAVRAHRSPGLEATGLETPRQAAGGEPGDPAIRARGPMDRRVVDRSAPAARPERAAPVGGRSTPAATLSQREHPAVDRAAPDSRVYGERPAIDRIAPERRVNSERPVVDRAAPVPRVDRDRPIVDRAGSAPPVGSSGHRVVESATPATRAYPERRVVDRSAPAARVDRVAPVDGRAAPPTRYPAVRSPIERPAPATRSYAGPTPSVERAAPPRAQVDRSYAPRAAPPAPRLGRDPRAEAAARSAPPSPPARRMESSRPAPAATSRSESRGQGRSDGGGHVQARSGGGSPDGGGRGGGSHARAGRQH